MPRLLHGAAGLPCAHAAATIWHRVNALPGTVMIRFLLFAFALGACACASVSAADMPAAVFRDPAPEKQTPASAQALQIPSHGGLMNALVYLPGGAGPHPVVVLLHGFPGNEQNLDLAQAMRRAGWAVVTFHYRGSWGSSGTFSFDGVGEDGAAVFDWLRDPATAKRLRIDTQRIVVAGHSMGGYVAAQLCATQPHLLGCVLIAPWDLSFDAASLAQASAAERDRLVREDFNDIDGRIAGLTARQVVEILATQGARWQLAKFATEMAKSPLLIMLAARDADGCKALALLPALKAAPAKSLHVETIDTDHGFNDHRIALEASVLAWLAALPAPSKAQ